MHGFCHIIAGCPVYWDSKLQSEITLSTTESEYVVLSMTMREMVPFMNLMREISDFLPIKSDKPKLYCTVWGDIWSFIKVAKKSKVYPKDKAHYFEIPYPQKICL